MSDRKKKAQIIEKSPSRVPNEEDYNTIKSRGEASPLQASRDRYEAQKRNQDNNSSKNNSTSPKNKPIPDRSPVNQKQPILRQIKDEKSTFNKKGDRLREASPENLTTGTSIGKGKLTTTNQSSIDFNQPGHRPSGKNQDKHISNSPNNPDYEELGLDNYEDDDGYVPGTHEVTQHNQGGYIKDEGRLVPRNTKVLGLINPENPSFMKAPKKGLSNVLIGNKPKATTPERVGHFADPNKSRGGAVSPGKKKFSRIAVAMMVSKGANCEDRIITRQMRGDESGGVVDLGTTTMKPKNTKNYEVKKFGGKKEDKKKEKKKIVYNPNQRLKAAKIVQAWWRLVLNNYQQLDDKIIKIQSVWRGTWYRLHLYDILYYTYLIKAFVEKLMIPIRRRVGKDGIEALLPWAQKYWVRKNLNTITRIQSVVRRMIANIRNKKKRSVLLIDKLYYKTLYDAFDAIRKFAANSETKEKMRKKKMEHFAKKLLQKIRVRIFHNLFFKLFKNTSEELRRVLFQLTMKKHSKSFNTYDIRKHFMTWMKAVNIRNNKAAPYFLRILRNYIKKPLFDFIISKLHRKIPAGFRERIIRRLIRNVDKFKDVVLQNYFTRWKMIATKMAGEEFKDHLTTNLLFRTKKKIEFNNMATRFRLWRRNVANIKDIKKFIAGLPKLRKGILKKVNNIVVPALKECVNGVKGRAVKALLFSFPKFQLVPLRKYFKKWRKIHHRLGQLEVSALFLTSLRRNNNSKVVYKLLFGAFQDWKRKATMLSYLDNRNKNDDVRNKNIAVHKMEEHLNKYCRGVAFKNAYPKIKAHLMEIIKNKSVKALFRSYGFLNKTCLRIYWNKLKSQNALAANRDLKNNFFRQLTSKFSKGMVKKNMRMYLHKWKKNCPNVKGILMNVQNGLKPFMRHYQRKYFRDPIIACFNRKVNNELIHEAILKSLGFSKKFHTKKLTDYLQEWRLRAEKLRAQLTAQTMSANFMQKHLKSFSLRILDKKFKHWKKKPPARFTLHQIFMRNRGISDAVSKYIGTKLLNMKKEIFRKLAKKNGNNAIMKAYMKFIDFFLNGRKFKKKFWLKHWKWRTREMQLRDVRQAIMKMAMKQFGIKSQSLYVGSYFFRWRNNVRVDGKFDDQKKYLKICQGFDKLDRFVKWKKIDFFSRLKRLMNLDTRGRVFLCVWKRAQKPRNSVSHCFEKWRRIAGRMAVMQQEKALRNQLTGVYMKKLGRRIDRDRLSKNFRLWKNKPKYSSNYFINLTDGFNMLCHAVKKKKLGLPFTLVMRQKNYKKLFNSLLPATSNLAKKFEKRQLRAKWDHWVVATDKAKTDDLRFNLFSKTNSKFVKKIERDCLRDRIRFWKHVCRRNIYNYECLVKGFKLLNKRIAKPLIKPFLVKLKKKAEEKDKNKGLKSFLTANAGFERAALRYKLKAWYKKMLLFDDKSKPVAIRMFKRFVIDKYYMKPVEKFWRRWLKAMIPKKLNAVEMYTALDHLHAYMIKKSLKKDPDFMWNFRSHRSPRYMEKVMVAKLLPNCKRLNRRYLRDKLTKWKKTAKYLAVRQMEGKFISSIYNKNQKTLMKRFLKMKFRYWAVDTKPKKEIDLRKVMWLNNKIYAVLVNKYLTQFIKPLLTEFSQKKFLRNCLMKNSKFHKRILVPFLEKWRKQNAKLEAKEMKSNFNGRIAGKTLKFYRNKTFTTILKNRLKIWRRNKDALKEIEAQITPEFVACIVKFNLKKNVPDFLKKLTHNKIQVLKKNISFGLLKKSGMMQKRITKNYLKKWLDQIKLIALKEFKTGIVKGFLRSNNSKRNKMQLKRAFDKLKIKQKMVAGKNLTPIVIGCNILKKFFNRAPWKKFKKITKNMNLVVPEGMSFTEALKRLGPDVAKAMVFRNIQLRPYWRQWKKNVEKMKTKDLEYVMFKKLFLPNAKNKGKVMIRNSIRRWKNNAQKMTTLEMKQGLKAGLMKNMYANNVRLCLKHFLKKWSNQVKNIYKFLERVALAKKKLYQKMYGKDWRDLCNRIIYKDAFDPKAIAKKIIMNVINNTEKGAILLAFNKWKKGVRAFVDLDVKRRILQVFLKNQTAKGQYRNRFHLQDRFYLWKVRANTSIYDKFAKYRKACALLSKEMRRAFIRPLLDGLLKRAVRNSIAKRLNKMVQKFDDDFKKVAKRQKFLLWRITVQKIYEKLKDSVEEMLRFYADNNLHQKQYTMPVRQLCHAMTLFKNGKEKAANKIMNFVRNGLENYKAAIEKRKRTDLKFFIMKLYEKEDSNMKRNYRIWKTNVKKMIVNESVQTMQSFLRKHLDNIHEGRARYNKGVNHIRNHVNSYVFEKLDQHAKRMRIRQLLLRNIKDIPDNLKGEFLRRGIKRWYEELRRAKMLRGINIINSGVRRFFCEKLKKKRLNRKLKTNKLVLRLLGKYLDKLKIYFLSWALAARSMKLKEAGNSIQTFMRIKLNRILNATAFNNLKRRFVNFVWKKIKDYMTKASTIKSDRGLILVNTLKSIYIEKPFQKLKKGLIRVRAEKELGSVFPKLLKAFRFHYIPFYFSRWRETAHKLYIKRLIRLQNWMRGRWALYKARVRERKSYLFFKYLKKMAKESSLIKIIYFKQWAMKAKILGLIKATEMIQSIYRGNTLRKNLDRSKMRTKAHETFKRMLLKTFTKRMLMAYKAAAPLKNNLEKINNKFEKQYLVNDIFDYGNAKIRNMLLFMMTKNSSFHKHHKNLKFAFDKFRRKTDHMHFLVCKVQRNWRRFLAGRNLNKRRRGRDYLLNLMKKYETSDKGKMKIAFLQWLNKVEMDTVVSKVKTLQNYLRKAMIKRRKNKIQRMLKKYKNFMVPFRIKSTAKILALHKSLLREKFQVLRKRMHMEYVRRKLLKLFSKRFSNIDDTLKQLYKKKMFNEYYVKVRLINVKRNESAAKIQANFKRYMAVKRFNDFLRKLSLLTRIKRKYQSQLDYKFELYFKLWVRKLRMHQQNEAAKTMQAYTKKVVEKAKVLRREREASNIEKGVHHMQLYNDTMLAKRLFELLREKIGSNAFAKMNINLRQKFLDLKAYALKKIKDRVQLKHDKASLIQKAYHQWKFSKSIWRAVQKLRKMKQICKFMMNKELRFLNTAVRHWIKKAAALRLIGSAQLLQHFLRKQVIAYKRQKKREAVEKFKGLVERVFNRNVLNVAKAIDNNRRLEKAFPLVKHHIWNKFKYRILNFDRLKTCSVIHDLRVKIIKKIMRFWLNKFQRKIIRIKKIRAISMIQKNYRIFRRKKILEMMKVKVNDLYNKYDLKTNNKKKYYFLHLWRVAYLLKTKEATDRVKDFTMKYLKRIRFAKRWRKVSEKLCIHRGAIDSKIMILILKRLIHLNRVFALCRLKLLKNFPLFCANIKIKRLLALLTAIFKDYKGRKRTVTKSHFLKKWFGIVKKMEARDKVLEISLDKIHRKALIINAYRLNDFFTFRRLLRFLCYVKGKSFFKKIHDYSDFRLKIVRMGELLVKHDTEVHSLTKRITVNRFHKAYIAKVLDRFMDRYLNIEKTKYTPRNQRSFLFKLSNNLYGKSEEIYTFQQRDNNILRGSRKMQFKAQAISDRDAPKEKGQDSDAAFKKYPIFCFFGDIFRKRKIWAFRGIKRESDLYKFFEILKRVAKRKLCGREFMDKFIARDKFRLESLGALKKFKSMLRTYAIKRLFEQSKEVTRRVNLRYLLHLFAMQGDVAKFRYEKLYFRKWVVKVSQQGVVKSKMLSLYKNMHLQFLEMQNQMFGVNNPNHPGIFDEFNKMSVRFDMYKGNADNLEQIKKKHLKKVKYTYTLDDKESANKRINAEALNFGEDKTDENGK